MHISSSDERYEASRSRHRQAVEITDVDDHVRVTRAAERDVQVKSVLSLVRTRRSMAVSEKHASVTELKSKKLQAPMLIEGCSIDGSNVEATSPNGDQIVSGSLVRDVAKRAKSALKSAKLVRLNAGLLQTKNMRSLRQEQRDNSIQMETERANVPSKQIEFLLEMRVRTNGDTRMRRVAARRSKRGLRARVRGFPDARTTGRAEGEQGGTLDSQAAPMCVAFARHALRFLLFPSCTRIAKGLREEPFWRKVSCDSTDTCAYHPGVQFCRKAGKKQIKREWCS